MSLSYSSRLLQEWNHAGYACKASCAECFKVAIEQQTNIVFFLCSGCSVTTRMCTTLVFDS